MSFSPTNYPGLGSVAVAPRAKVRRGRPGWERSGGEVGGKCSTQYTHTASGWIIEHCGHQTALWPYCGWAPGDARMFLSGGFLLGQGFRTVLEAQIAIEAELKRQRGAW